MRRITILATACLLSLFSAGARSSTIVLDPDEGPAADRANLPLDVRDEGQLLAWARGIPAVRTAMGQFAARGYIAHPENDRAATPVPGRNAVCFLMYEKPGYVAPPNCLGTPVIMVATVGPPDPTRTRTSAGFVIMDGNLGIWRVADASGDSRAGTSSLEAPFEVEGDRWILDHDRTEVLVEYAACSGLGNSICVAGAIGTGVIATPIAGIGVGLTCIATNTAGCLSRAIGRWPR